MTAQTPRLTDEALRDMLASRGMRVTEQRLLVLRALGKVEAPISHAELTERLSSSQLDRATVYRNLLSLHEVGVLVRTQLGDNIWRYELPRQARPGAVHGQHPHFVCTDCSEVLCLDESSVSLRGEAKRNQVAEVQLRGRCADCVRP